MCNAKRRKEAQTNSGSEATGDSIISSSSPFGLEQLSPAEIDQVDFVCDDFENSWKSAANPDVTEPDIKTHLKRVPTSIQQVLLYELIGIEIPYRRRRGQSIRAEDYLERFPDLDLRRFRQLNSMSVHSGLEQDKSKHRDNWTQESFEGGSAVLDDYRIIEEVGRGGMGIVYAAEQISLNRRVALKVLPSTLRLKARHVQRFQNEARAAASLSHPNIVPVYAVGNDRDIHFYVMQLIDGITLADLINECNVQTEMNPSDTEPTLPLADPKETAIKSSPSETARRLKSNVELAIQAGEALEHAHSLGIVHRDIKPSNLMLDKTGKLWVTDFGLARIATDNSLTASGDMLGTLRFMSPEQALAKHDLVDHRTDIYSLGATLYELITFKPAIDGKDRNEILRKIAFEEPIPLRKLVPEASRDLETIVMKSMSKEPQTRYQTAEDMVEDLKRFLEDRHIKAQRRTWVQELVLWRRRNRGLAAALATLFAVIVFANLLVGWMWHQERLARNHASISENAARQAERKANLQARALRKNVYLQQIALGEKELLNNSVGRAEQMLDRCEPELRDWEWYFLKGICNSALMEFRDTGSAMLSVAISPDGSQIATGSQDGVVRLWDQRTGQFQKLVGHTTPVSQMEYSRDGRKLATVAFDYLSKQWGEVKVWDVGEGRETAHFPSHHSFVSCVRFAPDGKSIVLADWSKIVRMIDLETNIETIFKGHKNAVKSVAISPDGSMLASGARNGELFLWNIENQKILSTLAGHTLDVLCLEFNLDGTQLASSSWDLTTILWDAHAGVLKQVFRGHDHIVWSVSIAPNGSSIATGSEDGSVRIWDVKTGRHQAAARGHQGAVRGVAFSPTESTVASVGMDGKLKIWDALRTQLSESKTLNLQTKLYGAAKCRPNSRVVAFASRPPPVRGGQGQLIYLDSKTGATQLIAEHPNGFRSLDFDPDGHLLVADYGQAVRVWNAKTLEQVRELKANSDVVAVIALADGGIAVGSRDGMITFWNSSSSQPTQSLDLGKGQIITMSDNPSGTQLAVSYANAGIRILRCGGDGRWQSIGEFEGSKDSIHHALAFSSDSELLVSGDDSGAIHIWDTADMSQRRITQGHAGRVTSIGFSEDGNRFATGGIDGAIVIWDMESEQEALVLRKQLRDVAAVTFSSDSGQLIAIEEVATQASIWNSER